MGQHPSSQSQWVSALPNYFNDAAELGMCIIIGEYGVMSPEAANNENRRNGMIQAMDNMFRAAIEHNVGRMLWAWFDRALPIATTGEGMGWDVRLDDEGNPTNLNWIGTLAWMDNRGELKADAIPPYVAVQPPPPPPSDNLIVNGNFTNGAASWGAHGGAAVVTGDALPAGDMPDGLTHAMQMPGGRGNGATQPLQLLLEPGATYRLTAWGRNSATVGAWVNQVSVQYHNNPASTSGHNTYHTVMFTGTSWSRQSATFTMPAAGFARAELSIWSPASSAADYWVTGIVLEKIS